jgi:hypothetical protein
MRRQQYFQGLRCRIWNHKMQTWVPGAICAGLGLWLLCIISVYSSAPIKLGGAF